MTSTKRHFANSRLGKLLPERLRLEPLGVGLFTLLLLAQCLTTASLKSVTYDEVGNLPAGYSYLETNDYRLYAVNPPLIKQIAALPLLFMDLRLPTDHWSWNEERTDHTEFGREFLFHYNHNPDRIVFWGRFAISILSVVLALLVYRFAKELFGDTAGMVALGMFVLEPNIVAHSSLANTDLGFTLFSFASVYAFYKWRQRPTPARFVLAGLVLGLALASKLTAWMLLPSFAFIYFLDRARPVEKDEPDSVSTVPASSSGPSRLRRWLRASGMSLLLVVIGLLVVFADYGFEIDPLIHDDNDRPKLEAKLDQWGIQSPPLREGILQAAQYAYVPARRYVSSMAMMLGMIPRLSGEKGGIVYQKFLAGNRSRRGFWYFPFLAFLIKTPIPLLILIAVASLTVKNLPKEKWAYLIVPVAMLILVSFKRHSFAFRYVNLPALPFLIVFASSIVTTRLWRRKLTRWIAVLLAAWMVVGTARISPHYLAYFNELIGGPAQGHHYMVNSNLDWGQDLKLLKKYLDSKGIDRIHFSYFGGVDPSDYGIEYEPLLGVSAATFRSNHRDSLPPTTGPVTGWVAISATCLENIAGFWPGASYDWLKKYEPVAKLGYSIFIYHIPAVSQQSADSASARRHVDCTTIRRRVVQKLSQTRSCRNPAGRQRAANLPSSGRGEGALVSSLLTVPASIPDHLDRQEPTYAEAA